jgi:hypothetical protein
MKNSILIMVCMSASILDAQTTVVKKYPNGMLDIVWHIRNLDTFLVEKYRQNGALKEQNWRTDSTYSYDNHKNIINKSYYFKKRLDKIGFCPDLLLENVASDCYQKKTFYPNGNIARNSYWSGDTLLKDTQFENDGTILKQNVFRKVNSFTFEWVVEQEDSKLVCVSDTLHSLEKNWLYNKKEQLIAFVERNIKNPYNVSPETKFQQYIQYDSLGKKYFEWKLDSNQIIPFKDNGLCLYGFVNIKKDTIIPA